MKVFDKKTLTRTLVFMSMVMLMIGVTAMAFQSRKATIPDPYYTLTTAEHTLVPVPVPSTSPAIMPTDVDKYTQYGYGIVTTADGAKSEQKLDLMPAGYKAPSTYGKGLIHFFTMTDMHITDVQSPAQVLLFGTKPIPGLQAAYSPTILYSTQVLNAAVKTVNKINTQRKKDKLDFGLMLGDAINNSQSNELKMYTDVLEGKMVNPNSDPTKTFTTDYMQPFKAEGLKIPWYQVLGNHDHFWSGMYSPTEYMSKTAIGDKVLNVGTLDKTIQESRGFYTGVIDASTATGKIIKAGPDKLMAQPLVTENLERKLLNTSGLIKEFPEGHGINQKNTGKPQACYSFDAKSNIATKVIVLDDTEDDTIPFKDNAVGANGYLSKQKFEWLKSELKAGQSSGKLMIIAAHIPISVDKALWDPKSEVKESELVAELHKYSNLILWVAGHRHLNTITALPSTDSKHPEYGFWEVETASLRDYVQQFRVFDININADSTISIITTNVDPITEINSAMATSRSYAVATAQIFGAFKTDLYLGPVNAELFKKLSPAMEQRIKVYKVTSGLK